MSPSNMQFYSTERYDGHPDELAALLVAIGVKETRPHEYIPCVDFTAADGTRWREVGFLTHYIDSGQTYVLAYSDAGDKGRLICLRTAEMVALGTFPDLSVYEITTTSKGARKQCFAVACRLDSAGRRRGQSQAATPESAEDYRHRMRKQYTEIL